MQNRQEPSELALTIVVTVVGGKAVLRRCLHALCRQIEINQVEIIVPFDRWSTEVGELAEEFPAVNFHFISNLGPALSSSVTSHQHRLYDRRRAVGLALARGRLVAMTEDYAVPADNWYRQILMVHEQPYAVIGGAIDNAVDHPLNWALYYCDFGRYGSPLQARPAEYVSDVNLVYKRDALDSVRDSWRNLYHETTVHWALRSRGEVIFLDPRIIVYQQRPRPIFFKAISERVQWGRVFAETRVAACSFRQRVGYLVGTIVLPALLFVRVFRNMLRQRRSVGQMVQTMPLAICLLVGWALGEFAGYLSGPIEEECRLTETAPGT